MAQRITVDVLRAKDLKREDGLLGKNDPYVELSIGHLLNKQKHKTEVHKNSGGDVDFNEQFQFDAKRTDELKLAVIDHDPVSNDTIGETKIPLDTLFDTPTKEIRQWYQIGEGSKVRGQVELYLRLEPASGL